VRAALVLSILLLPLAQAGSATGIGAGLAVCAGSGAQAGVAWAYDLVAGPTPVTTSVTLSWLGALPADYDLEVYVGDALDDGALTGDELVAASAHHAGSSEAATVTVPANGQLVALVIPWSAHGETYTLAASGVSIVDPDELGSVRGREVQSAAPVPEQQGFFGFCPAQ